MVFRSIHFRRPLPVWGPGLLAAAALLLLLPLAGLPQEPSAEPAPADPTIPVNDPEVETDDASPAAVELDTIEVTASKRIKSQRDIPGSVGALRGATLEKIGAQGLSDYLKRVPGVTLPEGEADDKVPVIRGIATESGGTGSFTALNAGIYADEMPFTDVAFPFVVPDLNPFDLERVEVLKGPQGTLYGSGALAGLIRYVLQKPKFAVWEGKLLATGYSMAESENLGSNTGVALNVPLFGDRFAIRAVGLYRDDPGLYDEVNNDGPTDESPNLETVDFNGVRQKSGRLLASWQTTDRLKLSAFYFRQDTDTANEGAADNPERFTREPEPFDSPRSSSFSGLNFTLNYEFDWGSLLSSSNRITKTGRFVDNFNAYTGTGIPEDPNDPQDDPTNPDDTRDVGLEDQNQARVQPATFFPNVEGYTQEIRISSPEGGDGNWEWLGGAFYQKYAQAYEQTTGTFPVGEEPTQADGLFPVPTPAGSLNGSNNLKLIYITLDLDAYDYALFGEVTRRLGEHWDATVGLRAFEQGLTGTTVLYGLVGNAISGNIENRQTTDYAERGLTPRFSLRYKHNRNMQAYLLAAKGYQFGGVQLNPAVLGLQLIAEAGGSGFSNYKSSDLWSYEAGLRTEWLDRRLRFDAALFYIDWKDLQLTSVVEANQTGVGDEQGAQLTTNVTGNVSGAHSEGLELALEVAPFAGAAFTSSAAWISALTDQPYDAPDGTTYPAGTRLPASARVQWSNVFSYERRLPYFDSFDGSFALSHSYLGRYTEDLEGNSPAGGYSTLDATLGLIKADAPVWVPEITFNATNLTDVRGVAGGSATGRRKVFYFNRPRTYLLTLGWQF